MSIASIGLGLGHSSENGLPPWAPLFGLAFSCRDLIIIEARAATFMSCNVISCINLARHQSHQFGN